MTNDPINSKLRREARDYVPNPGNLILSQKHGQLKGAYRFAMSTVCDPQTKQPRLTGRQLRRQLKTIQIDAAVAGDNIIIPVSGGAKQIYEVFLWNVTQQTIQFQQGTTGDHSIRLLRVTDCPSLFGVVLGFNGNFDQPHWELDNSQPLILNLQNGTQCDGFIRYRVQNGTY